MGGREPEKSPQTQLLRARIQTVNNIVANNDSDFQKNNSTVQCNAQTY